MKKIKTCASCGACKQIYAQVWYGFYREKHRYCTAHNKILESRDGCELWTKKERPSYDLSSERFIDAEKDIIYIAKHCNR